MSDTITLRTSDLVSLMGRLRDADWTHQHDNPTDWGHDEWAVADQRGLLSSLLAALPNPDDPGDPSNPFGPYGPGGPVIRQRLLAALLYRMLNPQPLPPRTRFGPGDPEPWRAAIAARLGPEPDPWRAAALARSVINEALAQATLAEVIHGERGGAASERIAEHISQFVDDLCPPPPKPPRPPRRWWWLDEQGFEVSAVDLITAGAQFQRAADRLTESALQPALAAAADKLVQTGVERLQQR